MDSWPYSRERSRSVAFRNNTVAPSRRQKECGLLILGSQPQALGAGQGTGSGGDLRGQEACLRGHPGMTVGSTTCSRGPDSWAVWEQGSMGGSGAWEGSGPPPSCPSSVLVQPQSTPLPHPIPP